MSGIQVTMPLQMMCRLMVASQVGENVTVPLQWKPAPVELTGSSLLPSGYIKFPEFGIAYKMSATGASMDDAREMCLTEDGQLAVIDSREKAEKIRNNFSYDDLIWVGLGQFHDTKKWITIDGKSTYNLPWAGGEPNGDYTCGALSKPLDGLRNMPCSRVYRYLCEIPLPRN